MLNSRLINHVNRSTCLVNDIQAHKWSQIKAAAFMLDNFGKQFWESYTHASVKAQKAFWCLSLLSLWGPSVVSFSSTGSLPTLHPPCQWGCSYDHLFPGGAERGTPMATPLQVSQAREFFLSGVRAGGALYINGCFGCVSLYHLVVGTVSFSVTIKFHIAILCSICIIV